MDEIEELEKVHYGFVSLVNLEKGFAYIKCQNSGYDNDIFVHHSVVDPTIFAVGDEVACYVELRENSKTPKARKPVWRIQGHKGGKLPELGEYTGKLVEIDDQGNAYVECEDFECNHGTRAFIPLRVVTQCRLNLGHVIGFDAQVFSTGVEVVAPCWLNCSEAWKQIPKAPSKPPPVAKLKPTAKAAQRNKNCVYFGRVKLADEIKGFSYVECPDSGYDRDVYVNSVVAPPTEAINKGDIVAFTLGVTDGQPQAIAPLWRLLGEDIEAEPLYFGTHVGRLVRKSPEGDGFVNSEAIFKDYGRDAFISRNIVSSCGIKIGDTLSFSIFENNRGMPQIYEPCWKFCSTENIPKTSEVSEAVTGNLPGRKHQIQHLQQDNLKQESLKSKYYVGRVVEVDRNRERSYIECPETGITACNVCAYSDVIEPSLLDVGDYVAFVLHINDSNLPFAAAPCWKLASRLKKNWTGEFAEWYGIVQDELTTAGDTFIICDELENEYERAAYVHSSTIEECQLSLGGVIAFSLHISPKGYPQITAPIWKLCSDAATAPAPGPVEPETKASRKRKSDNSIESGRDWKFGGKGKGKGKRNARLDPNDFEGSYAVGWVTQVDESNTCYMAEIPGADFGRDVFVPFSVAENLHKGDTIFFKMHTNKNGRPQASKFDVVWKLVHGGGSVVGNEAEIGTFKGTVKEINHSGGAHILCAELQEVEIKEAYATKTLIKGGLDQGDTIFFDVFRNDQGKLQVSSPCWKNVSPYEPPLESNEHARNTQAALDAMSGRDKKTGRFGEYVVGKVKSINLEKGHSMVDVPNSGYDRDVWVYKIAADPKVLDLDDTVLFQLHENSRGMPQAAAPFWKLLGPSPVGCEASAIGTYRGKLRAINADGSANVECPDIEAKFSCEALIRGEDLDATGLQPGDTVFFDVSGESEDGNPLVCSPVWKGCSEETWTLQGQYWSDRRAGIEPSRDVMEISQDVERDRHEHRPPVLLRPKLEPRQKGVEMKEEEEEEDEIEVEDTPEANGTPDASLMSPSSRPAHLESSSARKAEAMISDTSLVKPSKKSTSQKKDLSAWFFGRVKVTNENKGFSLIECPDTGFDFDVHVKSLVAPPIRTIKKDDLVGFKINVLDGKPHAIAPLWKLLGVTDYDSQALHFGSHVGKLARKSPEGDGFAECEAIMAEHNRDAFISRNIMSDCMLDIGDTILFTVTFNSRGFPQVQAPCWKCCSSENIPSTLDTFDLVAVTLSKPAQRGSHKPAQRESHIAQEFREEYREDNSKQSRMQSYSRRQCYYVGCVVRSEQNCFYIDCPETGYTSSVLGHRDTADPSLFSVGDHVAFPLHVSPKNLPQASAPLWKCVGPPKSGGKVSFAEWIGKVRHDVQSGTYIECEDIQKEHNRSALVYPSTAEACKLVVGETIAFSIQVSPLGIPQVTQPIWRLCSPDQWVPEPGPIRQSIAYGSKRSDDADYPSDKGMTAQRKGVSKGKDKDLAIHNQDAYAMSAQQKGSGKGKDAGKMDPKSLDGSYAVGWVKEVDEARSFYLAEVPGIDRGVFVPFSVTDGLMKGDTIFFMLHTNAVGRPQASKFDVVWKLVGRLSGGNASQIGTYKGRVKEINHSGGAHIDCPELKKHHMKDAYATRELVSMGLSQGDTICFDWHWNDWGKIEVTSPCWKNSSSFDPRPEFDTARDTSSWDRAKFRERLEELDTSERDASWVRGAKRKLDVSNVQPAAKTQPASNNRLTPKLHPSSGVHAVGWVKSIYLDRGHFTVEVPDSGYDRDVWVYRSVADPSNVVVGDTVFFQIDASSRDLPEAVAPLWKLVGALTPEMNLAELGTHKGRVRFPNIDGSANVECLDIDEKLPNDALIESLESEVFGGGELQPGDIIFFDIHGTSKEGLHIVRSPLWKSCSDDKWAVPSRSGRPHLTTENSRKRHATTNALQSHNFASNTDAESNQEMKEEMAPLEPVQIETHRNFTPTVELFPPRPTPEVIPPPIRHERLSGPLVPPLPSTGPLIAPSTLPAPASYALPPFAVTPHSTAPAPTLAPSPPWHASLAQAVPMSQAAPLNQAATPSSQPSWLATAGVAAPTSEPDIEIVQDEAPLVPGEIVEICGLTSEAGSPMNGLQVTVVKIVDTGRVQVRFDPATRRSQDIRLKALNLRRVISFGPGATLPLAL